jgi:exopolyphosphatase/guanosine-5'-triphosphate,3'-diphosphate pyrophosphatase
MRGSCGSVRCACLDIGSNTTRLLVAERDPARPGALREVRAERAFVRLTARERREGLAPERVSELAGVVAAHARTAREAGAEDLRVVATAALRHATGRDTLVAALARAAGVPVEVLDGEEEARLAFAGATAGLDAGAGTVAVVDAGGGSTELAAGTAAGGVAWWASVPLGSGTLAEDHLHADPPAPAQLAAARADARAAVAGAGCPGADVAWAVGGSATSLRRLVGPELTPAALEKGLAALCAMPAADAAQRLDLHVERARLLPAGLVLLGEIAAAFGCPLQVGCGGLREGVVLAMLDAHGQGS